MATSSESALLESTSSCAPLRRRVAHEQGGVLQDEDVFGTSSCTTSAGSANSSNSCGPSFSFSASANSSKSGAVNSSSSPPDEVKFPEVLKEADEDPPPGVVLRLAEVSGCELDACYAALMACDNDFYGALTKLREGIGSDAGGAKARAQMRAALQMLEEARIGRSVARGALGGIWIAAALLLEAFERIVPRRLLELLVALLGVRPDGPIGLLALLLPPVTMILTLIVLLRDLDGLLFT